MKSDQKLDVYVLIMAGGTGSRFWPKSTNEFPKQFIDVLGTGKSLLQMTYDRFKHICPESNIFILTNDSYSSLVLDQIPEIPTENIISEPSRNNTAPCITYASFKIAGINPDARIVVAPSDHLILNERNFEEQILECLKAVINNDVLITLGIKPTRPDTGYGYINFIQSDAEAICQVNSFMEKPDLETAKKFIKHGNYLWNAGIFIWNAKAILSAISTYAPELYSIFERGIDFYNSSEEVAFIKENYPLSPQISIDYAVMEHAQNVYTLPGNFGWSDLGTWASLYAVLDKDGDGNTFSGKVAVLPETKNCIIQLPSDKIAIVKGLNDYIVVDDGNALLIYPKNLEQEIKEVSKSLFEKSY